MIRYVLTAPGLPPDARAPRAQVTLRAFRPDAVAALVVRAEDARFAAEVRRRLLDARGFRGRRLGARTTPRDLAVAMASPELQALSPRRDDGGLRGS